MTLYDVPLVIRGEVIFDDLVEHGARGSNLRFRTPDASRFADRIVLRNPQGLSDVAHLRTDEIIDYLVELGARLKSSSNPYLGQAKEIYYASSGLARATVSFLFDNMANVLNRATLEEILEANIGRQALDGWQTQTRGGRLVSVRAFGARTVHISAGNAASIALHGVLSNALVRSDGIFKSPSNDPFTAAAIARTMIDMAPDHPLTQHVTVAYWRGGDEAFERRLFRPNNIEKIVAWGGFDSMRHIRGYLAPGIDLIALDPKISASIIGAAAFDSEAAMRQVAQRLAMDVGGFNQEACVNSRLVYVQSGTDAAGIDRLNQLGKLLHEAIGELPPEVSGEHPAFDANLRTELNHIRYDDLFRVIGGKGSEGAVIVSQESEIVPFSELLACRVANLVPVDTIDEAVARITIHTQTIGVYPDDLKTAIRDACALRGAQRLTSLGGALGESLAQPHDAIEQFRRMVRWIVDETVEPGQSFKVFAA